MGDRILFVTHQLSRTGAPIVLLDMIGVCLKEGCNVEVISLLNGELKSEIEQMGINVTIKDDFVNDWENYMISLRHLLKQLLHSIIWAITWNWCRVQICGNSFRFL